MKEILYVKFSNERNSKFRIKTEITETEGRMYSEKSAVCEESQNHINSIIDSYNKLKNYYKSDRLLLNKCEPCDEGIRFDFIKGKSLDRIIDDLLFENKNYEGAINEVLRFLKIINDVETTAPFSVCEDFVKIFGNGEHFIGSDSYILSNIDVAFSNVIVNDNGYNLIDYEWVYDFCVPVKYVQYRIILNYILDNPSRGIIVDKGLFKRLDFSAEEIKYFDEMERNFQKYVYGNSFVLNNFYKKLNVLNYNVVDIVGKMEAEAFKYITDIFFDYGEGVVPESVISLNNVNKDGHGFVEVDVKGSPRAVRIDPLTEFCILSNVNIEAVNDSEIYVPEFGTNGYKVDENTFVFNDDDTQFYIATDSKTKKVRMSYDIKIVDAETSDRIIKEIEKIKNDNTELNKTVNEKNNIIIEKDNVISEKEQRITEKENIIDQKNSEISNKDLQISYLNTEILNKNNQIEEIYNSTCWKITAPLRYAVGNVKKFFRNNPLTEKPYEFLYYIRRFGYKTAIEHYKKKEIRTAESDRAYSDVILYNEIMPLKACNKKIAVHLHLYYADLLEEFYTYLKNIPFKFDLYVSCKSDEDIAVIKNKFNELKNVNLLVVEKTINRGRDIAPLYVQFGNKIEQYDYFLHIHSKKSVYSGKEQYGWRQFSLDCLLGSEETVRKIFALFESDERIGLFYPETFGDMPMIAQDWLSNAGGAREILNSLNIEFEDGFFNYPVGSFFWARTEAVKPLFTRKFRYEDFPPEAGQTDGTTAHILERAISFVVKDRGYTDAIYDLKESKIYIGKSYKVYQNYFSTNIEDAKNYISGFDVVTFDIFDTLITRCVYLPDDIFNLMSMKIEKDIGIKCNYIEIRKKAEAAVWERKKELTSIYDIYDEIKKIMNLSDEDAAKIMNIEIETELKLCIPRRDMLDLFNYVKNSGKKVILISDMYLTSEIIEKMLNKCGYKEYDELWVSCDMGLRKDNGTMWNKFFSLYGNLKTIHIGDNPQSDVQTVIDRKRESFFVINPRTAFKMSRTYDCFKKYIDGSITNSLLLGMVVNGGIYNSPFCQGADGEPLISEYETMGYSAFGPLFTVFSLWINRVTNKDDILMFLAREGYIFEKVYNNIYRNDEAQRRTAVYFLASRRAVSVASIRSRSEVKSILEQYYRGSFSNLMKSRLGMDLYRETVDCQISMPEDSDKVMSMVEPYMEDIFKRAEEERKNYINYISNLGIDNNGIVVDVGYSGTIQYYLTLMLENKVNGVYLSTSTNKKPERLSCRCDSLYPLNDVSEEKTNKIFKNQLFLEAVLKAPYGQLICFKNDNGKTIPVYKDDSIIGEELKTLQKGILKYSEDFGNIIENLTDKCNISSELAGEILDACLERGWMSEQVAEIMSVQDDYCENGSHKFNVKTNTWEIIKE